MSAEATTANVSTASKGTETLVQTSTNVSPPTNAMPMPSATTPSETTPVRARTGTVETAERATMWMNVQAAH
jgi:hypothetical protein